MIANGKIHITITSGNTDDVLCFGDECLARNRVVIADAIVRTVEHADVSLLELSIVVPADRAEELVLGMLTGETKIAVGKISPVLDLD